MIMKSLVLNLQSKNQISDRCSLHSYYRKKITIFDSLNMILYRNTKCQYHIETNLLKWYKCGIKHLVDSKKSVNCSL
jgi:hypothetical protein